MHEMNEIEQNLLDSLEEARTEIKALKRDCVVCGERCETCPPGCRGGRRGAPST